MKRDRVRNVLATAVAVLSVLAIAQGGWAAETKESAVNKLREGQVVFVKEFAIDDTRFKGSGLKRKEKSGKAAESMPSQLAAELIHRLALKGYIAKLYSKDADLKGAVIVDGKFQSISGGSTAARVLVGFGSGRSKIKVHVAAYRAGAVGKAFIEGDVKAKASQFTAGSFASNNRNSACRRLANHIVDLLEGRGPGAGKSRAK